MITKVRNGINYKNKYCRSNNLRQ